MLSARAQSDRLTVAPDTTAFDSESIWRTVVEPVDPFLDQVAQGLAAQVETFDPEVAIYARYALTSQGKQLRPALLGLCARIYGDLDDAAVRAAVIVEMVHLATLVHDDIMDEASVRRSRPTLAANWGNQISVLLGDCLFAHALKLAAGYPTTDVCRVVSSATKTVCSGEILQTLRRRQRAITREDYYRILEMKTAELFAASCELGAWLGQTDAAQRQALRDYGLNLGVAYQIYDDCLDLFGSEAVAGKSLGTDLAGGKITLPLLIVMERSGAGGQARLLELIEHWDNRHHAELEKMLGRYDALAEAQTVVQGFLSTARKALSLVPACSSRGALDDLTHFLSQQTSQLGV